MDDELKLIEGNPDLIFFAETSQKQALRGLHLQVRFLLRAHGINKSDMKTKLLGEKYQYKDAIS